eukprot:TRINITY_DN5030_c0_g1_i1.p1 TRINITY_DN5030_c0_g1~~TRINITY_DN5030_c0_g1_i1.p1  ORF type:complete len:941 (-),score=164.95 TRINITY_DN5030_c0_g1_i1:37-2655(-)
MVGYVATTALGGSEYKIPLRCIPAMAEQPRVALCLHGLGDDRSLALWSHFWTSMLSKGFHVVALDLPGFGRADGTWSSKSFLEWDAELILRIVATLNAPPACISVFAEGIGACAFLRAYALNPDPFSAHHVLLNVQIGEVPKQLRENLEERGADILLCACEKFYADQPPWPISGINTLAQLLYDPSTMGLLGSVIPWIVKDAGSVTPFKSMKSGDWWCGGLEKLDGLSRSNRVMLFSPSEECTEELLQYASAPARKVAPKTDAFGPEKSAIEMGEINESFSVFIRIRPLLEREVRAGAQNCFEVSDTDFPRDPPPQRILVKESGDASIKGNYVFNRVFEESYGQEQVYSATAKPYVADFLSGTNVTIFAYGQTGTGKTYTISGPGEDPGIVTRCLSDIFLELPASGKELHFEYVQLYLDEFKDLLVAEPKDPVKLVEGKGGVRVQGLTSRKATSADQILSALATGASRRATRAHDMNEVSSRSHAILILRLKTCGSAENSDADLSDVFSSMFIVDLAGSERIARSGVTGHGFDEATSINLSLTSLGRVVMSLIQAEAEGSTVHIPYKDSPLTMVLKAGLGGNSKTALVACVTQAEDSMSESINTLRFAMQASHVKNKVAKKDAQDEADRKRDEIEGAGETLELTDGKGVVPLTSGSLEVWGNWQGPGEKTALLLGPLESKPGDFKDLIDALVAKGCQVLVPQLPGTAEKHLEDDVAVLIELCDWLGLANPVVYGRDWGAIRAIKYKMSHPKRADTLVLENFRNKVDETTYKERMKKDPGYVMQEYGGPWLWFFDGTYPKTFDGAGGNNIKGFKGKVVFLWPCHMKGKHDPGGKYTGAKLAQNYAKMLKTKYVDSFLFGSEEVSDRILAAFSA